MKRCIVIILFHFLFAGSTGQGQRPDSGNITVSMDTIMAARIAERLAIAWAKERALQIDTALSKEIVGRVDLEERPDGSVYAWIWKYKVIGRDTLYDKTIVKPVR